MRKIFYIAFLLISFSTQAQAPSKWYNKFGGTGVDIGYGIKQTFQRQYIVCGSSSSFGSGTVDAYLLLVDSMGQKIWEKNYGGALTDVAKAVVVNPVDSGFIFAGHSNSIGFGGYDVYVVRTDKNGTMIWQKSFGGIDWEFGNDIELAPDGNVIVCGYTFSKGYGKKDAYLLKLNSSNGALIWEKNYGGSEDDDFRGITLTSDNNFFLLTGKTGSYNDVSGDIYFLKTGLNGDSLLCKSYGRPGKVDQGNDIIERSTTEYMIGGGSESYSSGKMDAIIFKLTNAGDSVWLRNYGNSANDQQTYRLCYTYNFQGTYVITFGEIEVPFYKRDPKTLMLEGSAGYYAHGGTLGDLEDEELYSITNTSDKGFIGVGYTKSYGSVNEDILIMKYDSVIGIAAGDEIIGLKEATFSSEKFKLYPTIISETSPYLTFVTDNEFSYRIYDVFGRGVLRSGKVTELNQEEKISLEFLNPGVYIIEIEMNGRKKTAKIIKQ